ncbi:MAG: tRNA pseudouridine(55) synthase TruB [Candidatus Nomurabacteria bacterium]|jgi:tRNA pseudouridine55 synthase|nr:tRNA pseudouridine(55) synthase TruB [Candidatus Nomurabacteria bacterium]
MDNVILVDKPAGITSFGAVARVRRRLSEKAGHKVKVGHTGTLDPFATGLLILLSGKMTKKSAEFLGLDKEYEAVLRLGFVSSTGDLEGEITPYVPEKVATSGGNGNQLDLGRTEQPDMDTLRATLTGFVGKIVQVPPIFSAIKIKGERAYKLARKGETPEMPSREVTIYDIKILDYNYPFLKILCHVSSGTYIRSLARDIGGKLGTGAYLTELRRTKVGEYRVEGAEKIVL